VHQAERATGQGLPATGAGGEPIGAGGGAPWPWLVQQGIRNRLAAEVARQKYRPRTS